MIQPTRKQIEEYIKNNKLDVDESYLRSDWWKFKQQRDAYKKQRDELIKDIAKLRERNVEFEEKLDKEIKLSYEIEKNLYETSKERDELIKSNASVIKYNAELEKKAKDFDGFILFLSNYDYHPETNDEFVEGYDEAISNLSIKYEKYLQEDE